MDGMVLGLFLLAAFLGGLASGVAGFAMGFVVSGIWLHIITPIQTTTLIVGYGLWTQGYGVWKLRHALNWRSVAPFIIGGAIGVPNDAAHLYQSGVSAHRGRRAAGALQHLRLGAAGVQADKGRSSGRCQYRRPQPYANQTVLIVGGSVSGVQVYESRFQIWSSFTGQCYTDSY